MRSSSAGGQNDKSTKVRIAQKKAQLLAEMSKTVNVLVSLNQVLDDLETLTSSANNNNDGKEKSVSRKLDDLIDELHQWKETMREASNERKSH
jgi:protein subunit release factor B